MGVAQIVHVGVAQEVFVGVAPSVCGLGGVTTTSINTITAS